jgi:ABC-type glycerol-3-phosphate transport system permease component
MKHAIITLIIVFLFVLIVVPLMYIALGKLKNPVDLFALNKVGNSGFATQKSNFISPNYVPESGRSGEVESATSERYKQILEDVNNCFSEENVITYSEEYFALEKREGSKQNIKNNQTGTSRYFENFYPTPETEKTVDRTGNAIATEAMSLRPGCAKYEKDTAKLLAAFYDGGVYRARSAINSSGNITESHELTNQGLVIINGLQYYWFLYEDKNRIYFGPDDEVFYLAFYTTSVGDVIYRTMSMGSSLTYKNSSRAFLNQTQVFLGGTVYGTSTRALGPGATVDLQGGMRTASSSVVGSQNTGGSTSGSQPTTKAPAKYVPWTPAQ